MLAPPILLKQIFVNKKSRNKVFKLQKKLAKYSKSTLTYGEQKMVQGHFQTQQAVC